MGLPIFKVETLTPQTVIQGGYYLEEEMASGENGSWGQEAKRLWKQTFP